MSDPVASAMTGPAADDVIKGARLLRATLDGIPYEGEISAGLIHGLAILTLSTMIAYVAQAGAEGFDAQAAEVRRWLDRSAAHATLQALTRDEEAARG